MLSEFVKFISKSSCDEKVLRSHQVIVFRNSVVIPLLIPAVTSLNLQVLAFPSKQAVYILRVGLLFAYRMRSARIWYKFLFYVLVCFVMLCFIKFLMCNRTGQRVARFCKLLSL